MMFCAIALGSCGGDDKENDDPDAPENSESPETPDTPGTNLPEGSAAFVGYWVNNGSQAEASAFLFRSDGTGRMENRGSFVGGDWSFDSETSVLTTTMSSSSIDDWQFKVTSMTDNEWTGVYRTFGERTYWRGSNLNYARLLLPLSSWESGSLNLRIGRNGWSGDDAFIGSMLDTETGTVVPNRIELIEDDDPDDFVFKYNLVVYVSPSSRTVGSGIVTIGNPYDPSRTTITFTGTFKGTMQWKGWGWEAYGQ